MKKSAYVFPYSTLHVSTRQVGYISLVEILIFRYVNSFLHSVPAYCRNSMATSLRFFIWNYKYFTEEQLRGFDRYKVRFWKKNIAKLGINIFCLQ